MSSLGWALIHGTRRDSKVILRLTLWLSLTPSQSIKTSLSAGVSERARHARTHIVNTPILLFFVLSGPGERRPDTPRAFAKSYKFHKKPHHWEIPFAHTWKLHARSLKNSPRERERKTSLAALVRQRLLAPAGPLSKLETLFTVTWVLLAAQLQNVINVDWQKSLSSACCLSAALPAAEQTLIFYPLNEAWGQSQSRQWKSISLIDYYVSVFLIWNNQRRFFAPSSLTRTDRLVCVWLVATVENCVIIHTRTQSLASLILTTYWAPKVITHEIRKQSRQSIQGREYTLYNTGGGMQKQATFKNLFIAPLMRLKVSCSFEFRQSI